MRGTLIRPAENAIPGYKSRHRGAKACNVSARENSARRSGEVAHDETKKSKRQTEEMSVRRNTGLTMNLKVIRDKAEFQGGGVEAH
ncbi:MAG: hypothetical protein LBF80_03635 [Spirochaetaceae bacterium]|jgi:hypothetical protein|nr:hypothetical protein [Spirochaetaceae bacterium]